MDVQDKVAEKTQYYVPYNILPLDPDSKDQAIMIYPEVIFYFHTFCYASVWSFFVVLLKYFVHYHLDLQIQAAVSALRNVRGLPWPKNYQKKKDDDILDWLQQMFGFQVNLRTLSSFCQCYQIIHDCFRNTLLLLWHATPTKAEPFGFILVE